MGKIFRFITCLKNLFHVHDWYILKNYTVYIVIPLFLIVSRQSNPWYFQSFLKLFLSYIKAMVSGNMQVSQLFRFESLKDL